MRALLAAILSTALVSGADARATVGKGKPHVVKKSAPVPCVFPKRLIEVDALADDAGRPSKVVCR